jgi:hypothetical protein
LDAISMDIAFAHVRWDSTRHSLQKMTSWSMQKYSNGNSSCFRQDLAVIWVSVGFLDISIRWWLREIFMAWWVPVQSVHNDSSQVTHQRTDVFLLPRSLHGSHGTRAIPLKHIYHYYQDCREIMTTYIILLTHIIYLVHILYLDREHLLLSGVHVIVWYAHLNILLACVHIA